MPSILIYPHNFSCITEHVWLLPMLRGLSCPLQLRPPPSPHFRILTCLSTRTCSMHYMHSSKQWRGKMEHADSPALHAQQQTMKGQNGTCWLTRNRKQTSPIVTFPTTSNRESFRTNSSIDLARRTCWVETRRTFKSMPHQQYSIIITKGSSNVYIKRLLT